MITELDHIGIAVNKIEEALQFFEGILGFKLQRIVNVEKSKMRIAYLKIGKTQIELLEPTDKMSALAQSLHKKGEGIHHVAFGVRNIEETLQKMSEKGIRLIDEKPRERAIGGKIAFLEPTSTKNVPMELCET